MTKDLQDMRPHNGIGPDCGQPLWTVRDQISEGHDEDGVRYLILGSQGFHSG